MEVEFIEQIIPVGIGLMEIHLFILLTRIKMKEIIECREVLL